MTTVLPLVVLAALATATTVLLERGGRAGYGWVTGSEFALFGVALGPLGLDLLSGDLLGSVRPAVLLAVAWLGFRFGLRLRPSALRTVGWRMILASLIEPVVSLLVLRGLIEGLIRFGAVELAPATAWAIAAVGSATTKSSTAWARAQLGAKGGLTDSLEVMSTLDDVVLIAVAGWLAPRLAPVASQLPVHVWTAGVATLALGGGLALLVALLTGRGAFRADLGWIALFGVCALGAGLAASLALAPVSVAAAAGAVVGLLSPHADQFDELTRSTERPAVLVLLLLGGASLHGAWSVLALGAAVAVLRVLAKLGGGLTVARLLPKAVRRRDLGAGLLGAGGVAFAVAVALAQDLGPSGDLVLASAVAMALLGDFLGSPLLRRTLETAGELAAPAPEVAR